MITLEKLQAAWLSSGRSLIDFESKLNRPAELHGHEEYLVNRAKITLPTSFLSTCKSLLGEHEFDKILAELKNNAIEPDAPQVRSPDGLFVFRVCETIGRECIQVNNIRMPSTVRAVR